MNYSPSTIARVGDIHNGIHVQTASMAAATYLKSGPTQTEVFTVIGRIFIHKLFIEVLTVLDAQATVLKYTYTATTPTIVVTDLCAVCTSISALAVGRRIMWPGGAVATAATLTASAGVTDVVSTVPAIIGGVSSTPANYIGTIGINTATATMTSGAVQAHIFYTPASDGAYVSALL